MQRGTAGEKKTAVVRSAQNYIPAKTEGNDSASALAVVSGEDATLEAGITRVAVIDLGIALILFGGILSIVLYAMAATRRERALRVSPVSAPYTPVSAATAHGREPGARQTSGNPDAPHPPFPAIFFLSAFDWKPGST